MYFNPRSLAGATLRQKRASRLQRISIHAPSRERPLATLGVEVTHEISIHAPSRERLVFSSGRLYANLFQSTLPRGSDFCRFCPHINQSDFNPRSLAGATMIAQQLTDVTGNFNPRSLAGATLRTVQWYIYRCYFNPRSLAGATALRS